MAKSAWSDHDWRKIQQKICTQCRSYACTTGLYLPKLDNKNYQQWVCETCIIKATSPFVIEHIFEGTLSLHKVERAEACRREAMRHTIPMHHVRVRQILGRESKRSPLN